MIIQEFFTINNIDFVKTYSDSNVKIHGGMPEADWDEACDPVSENRQYTETYISVDSDEATIEDYENALRDLGVDI